MNEQRRSPSFFSLIQGDYWALLAVIFPVVGWGLFIYNRFIAAGPDRVEAASFFLNMAIVATVVGIPLLVWRLRSFQAHFARGVEVTGRVIAIGFRRDRGRVQYTYTYQGQSYQGANALHKTRKTQGIQPGDEVTLLVDPDNPKRALIRDIYV